MGPRAQFVIYGRQTVLPSPTLFDFSDIVRADRLHIRTNSFQRFKRFYPSTVSLLPEIANYHLLLRYSQFVYKLISTVFRCFLLCILVPHHRFFDRLVGKYCLVFSKLYILSLYTFF